ncbi:late embryogenesis abundant protein M17-like [Cynara cardunculus var. scolymus]|uniref:late embryogenesis abundant protein M17-like n=1 Tax=Cynara cardunculus var. scolymus TaxID=59895 RepID=UPI000D62C13C|nr:late embryogenesis abundant protein M17-like [Cynara cardunculus var. scolymus]
MKINSCLLFALLLLLVSCTLAVETSQQETTTEQKPEEAAYGGGGGWGCRHGCCYHGYRGGCARCCSSPEEAKAFAERQAHPQKP